MSLDDEIQILAQIPLFEDFQTEQLRLLAFGAEKRVLRRGDVLFREDEIADCAYLVRSGSVLEMAAGAPLVLSEDMKINQVYQPGVLIQPMALISHVNRPFGAMCDQNSEVMRLSKVLFSRMLSEYPHLALSLRSKIEDDLLSIIGKLDGVLTQLDDE